MTKLSNVLYIDTNTVKYWLILFLSYYVGYHLLSSFFYMIFILISTSCVIDVLYYFYNIQYYNSDLTIIRGYSTSTYFNDTLHSKGLDYGFNFYNKDYTKTPEQAQIDKFKYAIKMLDIKQGDKVIDIGCGCGDWLYYLQNTMKCQVIGVNITQAQADECRERGLHVIVSNWKDIKSNQHLKQLLYNTFDVVTFWDTIEHYVSMSEGFRKRNARKVIYQDMFQLAKNLINKESLNKRIWISCLHMRKEANAFANGFSNLKKIWWVYLLDKFHSGFYPSYYEENGEFQDELVDNAKVVGYNVKDRKDVTMDYYMTSKLNPTHFGRHRFNVTFKRLFTLLGGFVVDPFWIHRLLWLMNESWMEQFDETDINNSSVILWWLVLQ